MAVCSYLYCRAPMAEEAEACPRCGHPRDPRRLRDPAFLASIEVSGRPSRIYDMHQIVPAVDGVVEMQLGAMQLFGVERVLLQSAPPQATSLLGDEGLLALARDHGDRFWASQFADPRMPGAIEALERIADSGAKVVKILTPAGFDPDDPAFDPFWGTMQELGLVVMAHTGFITARHKKEEAKAGAFMSSRHANPLYFDRPARKFPELTIILCHLGGALWYEEAGQMVTQHENVWGDVSGFGLFALQRLLRVGAAVDWGKVFWGNDSPPFAYPMNLRLHLGTLHDAGAEALIPGLLYENGRRFGELFLGAASGADPGWGAAPAAPA
jgi:predicted TIM-barrel fold metal-dependent hydrolase